MLYLSFYTGMGIEAARRTSRAGASWRAWVIAKSLDRVGRGMVRRSELRDYALSLGMNLRTWQRWSKEAIHNGYFIKVNKGTARRADWWYILPSAEKVAAALGCVDAGRRVEVRPDVLLSPGWRAHVMAAWENGKTISREKIQKTVNIPVRTQTYRAAQLGEEYSRSRNYSKSEITADKIHVIKEYGTHKAPFVCRGLVYWRLPDTRATLDVLRSTKGRARKINRFTTVAGSTEGLSYGRQALTTEPPRGELVRLFNQTAAQRVQSERRIARRERRIADLYQNDHQTTNGATVWKHYPILG